jgi:glucokinase
MTRFVGVDVGGTKSASALIDGEGAVLSTYWLEHAEGFQGRLTDTVLASIRGLLASAGVASSEVAAYGVAVAGLISSDGSTVVHSPILGEHRLDLGRRLRAQLAAPVIVVNDANATLYGHVHHAAASGAARTAEYAPEPGGMPGSRVSLLLTLGTGLGGAFMVDDTVVVGCHGFASELGHVIVDFEDERRCACGNPGCVENYASGRGLCEMAAASPPPPESAALLASLGATRTSKEIVAAAEQGDPWAIGLLEAGGKMLGRAISILSVTLDPEVVVIGGSFGHATSRWLLPAAVEEMKARWPFGHSRALPELVLDSIGPYAAATGAAMLAAAGMKREVVG